MTTQATHYEWEVIATFNGRPAGTYGYYATRQAAQVRADDARRQRAPGIRIRRVRVAGPRGVQS